MELLIEQISADELVNKVRNAFADELKRFKDENKPKEPEVFLTRNEAAQRLGITLPTLHKYIKMGYIEAYRLGSRTVRFKKTEVEKALNQIQNIKYRQVG